MRIERRNWIGETMIFGETEVGEYTLQTWSDKLISVVAITERKQQKKQTRMTLPFPSYD